MRRPFPVVAVVRSAPFVAQLELVRHVGAWSWWVVLLAGLSIGVWAFEAVKAWGEWARAGAKI